MTASQEGASKIRIVKLVKEGLEAKGAKEIPDGLVEEIREGV